MTLLPPFRAEYDDEDLTIHLTEDEAKEAALKAKIDAWARADRNYIYTMLQERYRPVELIGAGGVPLPANLTDDSLLSLEGLYLLVAEDATGKHPRLGTPILNLAGFAKDYPEAGLIVGETYTANTIYQAIVDIFPRACPGGVLAVNFRPAQRKISGAK